MTSKRGLSPYMCFIGWQNARNSQYLVYAEIRSSRFQNESLAHAESLNTYVMLLESKDLLQYAVANVSEAIMNELGFSLPETIFHCSFAGKEDCEW